MPISGSPTRGRPLISSQPSRSISNGFIRTSAAGKGQLALCWSIALEIASRFFASALLTGRVYVPAAPYDRSMARTIAHLDMDESGFRWQ